MKKVAGRKMRALERIVQYMTYFSAYKIPSDIKWYKLKHSDSNKAQLIIK